MVRPTNNDKILKEIERLRIRGKPFSISDVANRINIPVREFAGILRGIPGARRVRQDTCAGPRSTEWIMEAEL